MKRLKNAEVYRYLKSQNTKIYLLILFVFFLGIAGVMKFQEESYINAKIEDLTVEFSEASQGHSITFYDGRYEFGFDYDEASRQLQRYWTKMDSAVQSLLNQYKNDRFPLLYFNRELTKYYRQILVGYENGYEIDIITLHNPSENAIERELMILDYCYETGIPYPKSPNTVNLANFWNTLFSNEYLLGVLMVIAVMNIPLFAKENETGVYKQMYTQSYSRKEITKTKIKISIEYSLILFAVPFALASIVIGLIFGLGYLDFPAVINVTSIINLPFVVNNTTLTSVWVVLLYKLIMFIGLGVLVISTCHFVAIYTGSSSTTLAVMSVLIAFTYMIGQFVDNTSPLKIFWIYGYYRTNEVLNGDIPTTVLTFIALISLVCFVLVRQSIHIMNKKDMTGEVLE